MFDEDSLFANGRPNKEAMRKMIDEHRTKSDMITDITDLLADLTGDTKLVFLKSYQRLVNKAVKISDEVGIDTFNKEQIKQLTSLFSQFSELLEDWAKENNIKL